MFFLCLLICRFVWRIRNSVIFYRNFFIAVFCLNNCIRFHLCWWPSFATTENDFFKSNKWRLEEECANDGKYQCHHYVSKEEIDLMKIKKTVLDRFHGSRIPPRKCAQTWIIAIFAVQMLFFFLVCRTKKYLTVQYKLLPLYGSSFAALWPSTNKQSAVQKSVAVLLGRGVKVSPRTACCCQKVLRHQTYLIQRANWVYV